MSRCEWFAAGKSFKHATQHPIEAAVVLTVHSKELFGKRDGPDGLERLPGVVSRCRVCRIRDRAWNEYNM